VVIASGEPPISFCAVDLTRARAAALLASGPADSATVVAHACGLSGAPPSVAEHLAAALLAGHSRFARGSDGRWALAATTGTSAPTDGTLGAMSFAVVDVETTGGRPAAGHRVTEIAIVVVERGVVGEVFQQLVNPERSIPPFITALTNISWAMVRDQPRFAAISGEVRRVLDGRVFVAHNAAFDWAFVSSEFARAGDAPLAGPRLCTVRLARRLLPQLRSRSLDHVSRHYGVAIGARHRAAGDAVATAECLLRLFADAESRGVDTWHGLQRMLSGAARP